MPSVLKRWAETTDRHQNATLAPVQVNLKIRLQDNRVVIVGNIATEIDLICQRCLSALKHMIDTPIHWLPVLSLANTKNIPDDLDPVEICKDTGLLDLYWHIEDQLLLEVPCVPKHANIHACEQSNTFKILRANTRNALAHTI